MTIRTHSWLKRNNAPRGNRIYQYLAGFTGTLGIISSEMHYGWPSPSLPVLKSGNYTFQITPEEGSTLAVMPLVGAILGAAMTGVIIDRLGRKRLVLFSALPFFFAWIMIGCATSSALLYVARFMAGLADGLSFTAVPMYLGEIAEPDIRGLLGSMCPVSIVFGLLLINIIGSQLSIPSTAYTASVIPVILLLTFSWMPKSPYYLLMRNRPEEARRSLQQFRGLEDVDGELHRLATAVKQQSANTGKFMDLFTVRSNLKAVLIALSLRTFQQLTGTIPITIYCQTIFQETKEFIDPGQAAIIFFTIQLLMSIFSSLVVDRSGRRPLLLISASGTAIALCMNGTYLYIKHKTDIDTSEFNFLLLVSMVFYIIIFSLGLQTIPLLIMGEVFPTNVKAFALCIADINFSVIASLMTKFFQFTSDTYGMHVPFYTFAVCCVIGLVLIYLFIPETKGRTLEEIQLYLKGELEL